MATLERVEMRPKVSIVTINLNMRAGLERTIQSVLGQTYPNIEFVVIDGGSSDGSAEYIRQYASKIAYWVSEPDNGLFDAMNKGTRASTGDWVLFMNSDDCFADKDVVADVFSEDHNDADLVYGHMQRRYDAYGVERIFRAESPNVLRWRMNCSHQSVFSRRELLLAHPFGENIAADYEFLLTAYSQKRRFKLVDRLISVVAQDGISDRRRTLSLALRWRALKEKRLTDPLLAIGYTYLAVRGVVGVYAKRILGRHVTAWILRHRRI